jgi:hypothetical protein
LTYPWAPSPIFFPTVNLASKSLGLTDFELSLTSESSSSSESVSGNSMFCSAPFCSAMRVLIRSVVEWRIGRILSLDLMAANRLLVIELFLLSDYIFYKRTTFNEPFQNSLILFV